jgi:hypothetical protein
MSELTGYARWNTQFFYYLLALLEPLAAFRFHVFFLLNCLFIFAFFLSGCFVHQVKSFFLIRSRFAWHFQVLLIFFAELVG